MNIKKRYFEALDATTTIFTRIMFAITFIALFLAPKILFPGVFSGRVIFDAEILNILLVNVAFWFLTIVGIGITTFLTAVITGLISWIIYNKFEKWASVVFKIPETIMIFLINTFMVLFGQYEYKWYFLKKIFRPKEVAKELLED